VLTRSTLALSSIATTSGVLRAIERFFESVVVAWQTSDAKAALIAALTPPQPNDGHRVRMAGWAMLGAAGTRILLVGIDGLVRPPISGIGWIAAVPLALACIARPKAVLAAWNSARISMGRRGLESD